MIGTEGSGGWGHVVVYGARVWGQGDKGQCEAGSCGCCPYFLVVVMVLVVVAFVAHDCSRFSKAENKEIAISN